MKGIVAASEALLAELLAAAATDGLLQRSKDNECLWFAYISSFILFSTINYKEVLIVLTIIVYTRVYTTLWVYKVFSRACT